jgi:hypothetical protein
MFAFLPQLHNLIRQHFNRYLAQYREARRWCCEARRRQATRKRPFLEGLENRIVPTAYVWTNADLNNDYTDAKNWTSTVGNGVPSTGDSATIPAGTGA